MREHHRHDRLAILLLIDFSHPWAARNYKAHPGALNVNRVAVIAARPSSSPAAASSSSSSSSPSIRPHPILRARRRLIARASGRPLFLARISRFAAGAACARRLTRPGASLDPGLALEIEFRARGDNLGRRGPYAHAWLGYRAIGRFKNSRAFYAAPTRPPRRRWGPERAAAIGRAGGAAGSGGERPCICAEAADAYIERLSVSRTRDCPLYTPAPPARIKAALSGPPGEFRLMNYICAPV